MGRFTILSASSETVISSLLDSIGISSPVFSVMVAGTSPSTASSDSHSQFSSHSRGSSGSAMRISSFQECKRSSTAAKFFDFDFINPSIHSSG